MLSIWAVEPARTQDHRPPRKLLVRRPPTNGGLHLRLTDAMSAPARSPEVESLRFPIATSQSEKTDQFPTGCRLTAPRFVWGQRIVWVI